MNVFSYYTIIFVSLTEDCISFKVLHFILQWKCQSLYTNTKQNNKPEHVKMTQSHTETVIRFEHHMHRRQVIYPRMHLIKQTDRQTVHEINWHVILQNEPDFCVSHQSCQMSNKLTQRKLWMLISSSFTAYEIYWVFKAGLRCFS